MMKKPLIALLHIGYWFVYLLLAAMMTYAVSGSEDIGGVGAEDVMAAAFFCIILLPAIVSFYTFYLVLFPRFFRRKKFGVAFLAGAGLSIGTTFLGFLFVSVILYPECGEEMNVSEATTFVGLASYLNLVGGTVAIVIKGFSTWFEEVKLKEALQEKNHAMELALVKSQLDPHFLFNTINNIDVLILKDPEEASGYLNRLSDIMRFMLYETKTDEIALSKEIAYIEKYIALQKIRTANASYVDFQVSGVVRGRKIAPMVFIPFTFSRFLQAVDKARLQLAEPATAIDYLFVKTENRLEKISVPDILFIEGMRDYRRIHCRDKRIMTLQTFGELARMLPPAQVCRVHKSYMVGFANIEAVERSRIVIGKERIPVSETYRAAFFALIKQG